jgi:serpin B
MHKAVVEVGEKGTEAAAVTAVEISTKSLQVSPPTPRFTADHPFLFLIRDQTTGTILFMGRLTSPTAD